MQLRKLTVVIVAISIAFVVAALAIPRWHCGSLFEDCCRRGARDREAMIAIAALLVVGLACLIIIFIIDLVLLCQTVVSVGTMTARFVLLYLGVACIVIAVIVYTVKNNEAWSYVLVVVGAVFSILIALLAISTSQCVNRSDRVVVHTVRA